MRFEHWHIFYWIWVLLPLGGLLFYNLKRRRLLRERFAEKDLIGKIAEGIDEKADRKKIFILLGAVLFSIFALMRPQWGFEWQEVRREGLNIIVAIDTSNSMLSSDVKPSRLERSKLAVKDLIKKLHGDRVGLIAFAGDAFLICPLTVDYQGFLLSLEDLNSRTIPQGGTSLAAAIKEGLRSYKTIKGKHKVIVVITDGEDLQGDVPAAIKQAKEEGVQVYCVGIGTPEGELVRIRNNEGAYEFLKDAQGNFVKSRLNEAGLQEIALKTGGTYVRASGARFGLEEIYQTRLSSLEKEEFKSKMEKRYFERFQIPLAFAFFLLCWHTLLKEKKNG